MTNHSITSSDLLNVSLSIPQSLHTLQHCVLEPGCLLVGGVLPDEQVGRVGEGDPLVWATIQQES